MPSPDTFSIPPIAALLRRALRDRQCIVDPFARNSGLAHWRNDLNPNTQAESHQDAEVFLAELCDQNIQADAFLFDPPYSPRQITEVYQQIGRPCSMEDTQSARLYRIVKDRAATLMIPDAIAVCCGWSSVGMGVNRGFELIEILLVSHGGAHNDTIVTVERKLEDGQYQLFEGAHP